MTVGAATTARRRPWWRHRAPRFVLSLAILGACIWYFSRLDLHATWTQLLASNWRLLALAAAANLILHLGLKSLRWHALIAPHVRISWRRIYLYTLAGNAGSHALPARAGEAVRATLLARHGVPLPTSAGIQVIEAAVETWSLLLVALPLPWVLDLPPGIREGLRGLFALGAALVVVAILLARHGRRLGRLTAWLERGAQALRSASAVWIVAASTLAARFVDASILMLVLHAVGLRSTVWEAFLVILAVDAVLIVPSTPGGLGAFEAACVGALHLIGIPPERALAFGVAYHAIQQIPGVIAGATVLIFTRTQHEPRITAQP